MNTLNTIFFIILSSLITFSDASTVPMNSIDQLLSQLPTANAIEFHSAVQSLKKYDFNDFTDAHKAELKRHLLEETPHLNKLVELCGFLLMKEELRAFAQNKNLPKKILDKLNYALVRAGDTDKLRALVKNLKKQKLNDDFAYNLSTMLAYTRQKEVFDHLLERAMDTSKSCNHPDMDTPGKFTCAYAIINSVAPYINDFPVEYDEYGIRTSNPQQTLKEVRQWISENKESYTLNTSKY